MILFLIFFPKNKVIHSKSPLIPGKLILPGKKLVLHGFYKPHTIKAVFICSYSEYRKASK